MREERRELPKKVQDVVQEYKAMMEEDCLRKGMQEALRRKESEV